VEPQKLESWAPGAAKQSKRRAGIGPYVSSVSSARTRYKPLVPAELKLFACPGTIETRDGLALAQYTLE
jgi:hypothetical protein